MEVSANIFIVIIVYFSIPGILSQYCDRCERCSSVSTNNSAVCKCDRNCLLFNDCCCEESSQNSSATPSTQRLYEGISFSCQSIYANPQVSVIAEYEAFVMVSSCPTSWVDPANMAVERMCTSGIRTLPPITDMTTGVVYRNEYCALCNQVTELMVWTYRLLCKEFIYHLIQMDRLEQALINDTDIFNRECNICYFISPLVLNNGRTLPLRSCVPNIDTCLPHRQLETVTSKRISEENYVQLVNQCQSEYRDLVSIRNRVYRNKQCAVCNGESLSSATCLELNNRFRDRTNIDDEICQVPEMTTEVPNRVPTTVATTEPTTRGNRTRPDEGDENGGIYPIEEIAQGRPLTFTVTLSNLGKGQVIVSSSDETTEVSITCPEGEILVGVECRPTHCPEGYMLIGERCSYVNVNLPTDFIPGNGSNYTNCSNPFVISDNSTYIDFLNDTIFVIQTGQTIEVLDYDELGNPVICRTYENGFHKSCTSKFVTLKESDYEDLKNGSILFQNTIITVHHNNTDGSPVICTDLIISSHMQKFLFVEELPGIRELTYIGNSLSLIGAAAIVITYLIFKELKTFPGIVLMNLCVAVLIINALFLIGGPSIQYQPSVTVCSTIAIFLHYFYLAQFSWMTIFSFETTKSLYRAQRLIQNSNKDTFKWFLVYFIAGWIFPLVNSVISITLNYTTELIQYGVDDQGELDGCFINHYISLIAFFLLPLILSLTSNLILLIIITVFLCRAYKEQSKMNKSNIGTMVRVWLAIFTVTGLSWTFGFLAISKEEIGWMWYPFVIFNSTVGFIMFLTFIFTKKVFNLYRGLIKRMVNGRGHERHKKRITRATQRSRLQLVPRENLSTSIDFTKENLTTVN